MGSGTWLQLLLTLGALWGIGARETQLGILGEPTLLQIPRKFQERTEEFGEATWKKTMEGSQKKTILLKISGGNVTEYERERMRFHRGNFSLEILNTSRDDERLYEYSVSKGPVEELWQIQLHVFEPVADPSIQILHRELSNGSCSLSLLCTSERGDEVSYSWDSWDNRTREICSGNGRVLNVSYSLWNDSIHCICTARNRVSSRDMAFDSSQCGSEQRGVPGVRTDLIVLLVALGVIIIIIVAIVTVRATHSAKCYQVPSQVSPISATSATSATIYAQVQKPKGPVPNTTSVSCTTIYTAATGPPLATDRAPRSPAVSPTPRGHPQDTTTVYASVTLPVA